MIILYILYIILLDIKQQKEIRSAYSFYIPYTRKYWRIFNLTIFAVEPPTKILAVLNLAIFPMCRPNVLR